MTESTEFAGGGCRSALVTGGTSGLGLAMAAALARAGLRVAVAGRSGERADEVAGRLPGAFGVELDVRDEGSVARAIGAAWSRLDGIDLLVNNAGIGMRTVNPDFMTEPRGFWTVPTDGFRDVIATNLTGYFLVAREVTPRMLAVGRGRIVNISVNEATMTRAGFVPYGPSRAATESLSRIMAADLSGTPITVNLLLPGGATRTGMVPDTRAAGRLNLLEPEIMGPPIVWLASAEASQVNDERIVAAEFEQWLDGRRSAGDAP
jgi:NAD(P)-dependent dehydrogenase (short-subunit alcohol dehydrogenase family)